MLTVIHGGCAVGVVYNKGIAACCKQYLTLTHRYHMCERDVLHNQGMHGMLGNGVVFVVTLRFLRIEVYA